MLSLDNVYKDELEHIPPTMKKIIGISTEHPLIIMVVLAVITIAALTLLPRLQFQISAQSMMVENGSDMSFYDWTRREFGSEEISVIFLHDPDIFSVDKLEKIRQLIDKLGDLPFVSKAESLFSAKSVETVNEQVALLPYLDPLPRSPEAVQKVLHKALNNPFVEGNLLSASGQSLAINVHFDTDATETSDFDRRATQAIETLLRPLRNDLETVFQVGSPLVRDTISSKIIQDQKTVLPLALLVLLLTLGLTLRRLSGMVLPLATAGMSVIWTLGMMALLNIPVSVMTAIVPALLVIIGSTEDIHLLSEYLSGVKKGLSRKQAIKRMGKRLGLAVGLTFITTYLGFLSISMNDIGLLTEFGIIASTGLLFNFIITLVFIPAMLSWVGPGSGAQTREPNRKLLLQEPLLWLLHRVRHYRKTTLGLALLILCLALVGASRLQLNNNSLDYLGSDATLITQINQMEREMSGLQTLSIVVYSGIRDTFLDVRYLEEITRLQTFLSDSGIADKSFSIADYLSLIDRSMQGEPDDPLQLPEENALVEEYMLFLNRDKTRGFLTADNSKSRILVRHRLTSSASLQAAIEQIEHYASTRLDPGLMLEVTGQSVLTARAADHLASAQIKSLLLMVLVILVVIGLLFFNLKAGLLAIIPNLFPVLVLFGFMGFMGIPLDTGTAMTAAIAIGICVDDTMHFMIRYHQISRREENDQKVLEKTVREEALPIMSTSIALAAGFAVLIFSDFPPIAHFGLLSTVVMLLALITTFIITPLLLSYIPLVTVWDLLAIRMKAELLQQCKLFTGLRPLQIKKLILSSVVREFQPGEHIIREGENSHSFFVILDGKARAQRSTAGQDDLPVQLREMDTGEVFGEIALVSNIPRTADVIADTPLQALELSWDSITRISNIYPRIATRLFRNLASIIGERLAKR
jgi:predicted RND superfamily exporter protein